MRVMDNIEYFCTDYDVKKYTDWERIIDTYFKTKLACDRNIIHFSEYDILYNRVSNLKLLEG
jgi:hypothetical protein